MTNNRSYGNVIFRSLDSESRRFVRENAQNDDDMVLPLCTFVTQLKANGRSQPRSKILNERQLKTIRECYHLTIPEPGTPFGILLCKTFLEPRQQDNFDIKRPKLFNVEEGTSTDFYSNDAWMDPVEKFMSIAKTEMLLSMKKNATIYMSFLLRTSTIRTVDDFKRNIVEYILPYTMCVRLMNVEPSSETPPAAIASRQNFYFVVYVLPKMETSFLLRIYSMPILSLQTEEQTANDDTTTDYEPDVTTSRLRLIFTSNRSYFNDKHVNVMNSMIFLYCFITDRYKPDFENISDDITNYMVKLVSMISYEIGGYSLKRNGLAKSGVGPLAFVISEAGLIETPKFTGTADYPKNDGNPDETIPSSSSLSSLAKKTFLIESYFERIFVNLPLKMGLLNDEMQLFRN